MQCIHISGVWSRGVNTKCQNLRGASTEQTGNLGKLLILSTHVYVFFYSSLLQRTSQIQTTSKGSKSTYLPPPPPSPKKRLFSSKLNLQVPLIVKMLASVFLNHPLSERVDLFFLSRYPCLWKDLPLFDVYLLHPKPGTFIIHK